MKVAVQNVLHYFYLILLSHVVHCMKAAFISFQHFEFVSDCDKRWACPLGLINAESEVPWGCVLESSLSCYDRYYHSFSMIFSICVLHIQGCDQRRISNSNVNQVYDSRKP